MKLSDFDIDFIKFKNEKYTFVLKLDDTFFSLKENSLYQFCDIDVTVDCEKNDNTINLTYTLDGHVNTQCERCLKDISLKVKAQTLEPLKMTPNQELLQNESYISIHQQVYSIYDSLYEQICLNLPLRQICETSITNEPCEIDHPSAEKDDKIDERWAELKKLIK